MKKLLLSFLAATAAFSATSALAAPPRGFVNTPAGFCQSQRWTNEKYRPWVELHALNDRDYSKQQLLEWARDPKMREALRQVRAEGWGRNIARGQFARCENGVTYWNDPATVEAGK